MYIFPELEAIHQFVYPDNSDNLESRIKQQRFYKSLIKRHLYVFNKNNEKQFLSKNPIHLIRLESLTTVFPNAKHLLLQRPLEKTIPSTISLNENLYSFFCTLPVAAALAAELENENMGNNDAAVKTAATVRQTTIKMLIEWQGYIQGFENKNDWERLEIDFEKMVKSPSSEAKKIHDWLNLSLNDAYKIYLRKQDEFSKNYESRHTYEELTGAEISALKK
jgi:ribosomal protein S8